MRFFSATAIVLGFFGSLSFAHEKPTPEQLAELQAKGLLDYASKMAGIIGEEQEQSGLIAQGMLKVKRAQLQALGLSEKQVQTELDSLALAAPQIPARMRGTPSVGTVRNLTILIDFADFRAATAHPGVTLPKIEANIYGTGTEAGKRNAPYDSMTAYYKRASHNKLDVKGKMLGWFNLPGNRATYEPRRTGDANADSEAANQMIFNILTNIMRSVDAQEDFSVYDNDNDGTIDNVDILWTGPTGQWMGYWWPVQWSFSVPDAETFRIDGKRLRVFSWQNLKLRENDTDYDPSTLIHEFGHVLGLPDLYDYKANTNHGIKGGVGSYDIMDASQGGMNGFYRWILGWIDPQIIAAGEPRLMTFNAAGDTANDQNKAVVVFPNANASAFREFFLLENRHRVGNDGGVAGQPSDGLAIWHVDGRLDATGENFVSSNSNRNATTPGGIKMLRLVQADGLAQIETTQTPGDNGAINYGGRVDENDLYKQGQSFGPATNPNSNNNAGTATNVLVDTISAPGPVMTARVGFLGAPAAQPNLAPAPTATIDTNTAPAGANFNASLGVMNSGNASAGSFRIRFYASTDEGISDDDISLGFFDVSSVSNGSTETVNPSLNVPLGTPPGAYRIGWVIDSEGVLPELEEGDNVFVHPDGFIITGPLQPEIIVDGRDGEIPDGFTAATTEFGTLAGPVRVGHLSLIYFNIRNAGQEVLTLGSNAVTLSGAGASHFSVAAQPPTTLLPGASAPFAIRFAPTIAGLHTIDVNITSDDFNEAAYNFRVDGRALAATDDHGDDISVATTLPLSTSTGGVIDLGGDVDVFSIQIASTGHLLVASSGAADTAGALLSATGDLIVFNDDFGNNTAFTLAANVTPGTYYLIVSGTTASSSGSYSITATLGASGGSDDHGNTSGTASVANPGEAEMGVLEYLGDVDVFRVTLTTAGELTLQSTGVADTFLTLKDSSGAVLTTSQNGGDFANFLYRGFLPAGTYYAEVSGGSPTALGAYTLVTSLIPGTPPDDHGNVSADATAISTDGLVLGTFERSGDVDVFRVVLPSAGRLAMHSGGPLDPNLELRDSGGALLLSDADSGPGANFQAVTLLSAGTYYLHLSGFNASLSGSYRLHTNFTPNAIALADDHNELPDTGTALSEGIGSAVAGNLSVAGDTDFFRITITQSGFLQVLTTGSADTDGALFDSSGIQVLADDDSGAGSNFLLPLAVTPGTYYARVRGYQGTATGAYSIYYTFTSGAVPDDHLNTIATITNPALPSSTVGMLNYGGDVDVFRITLTSTGTLQAHTQGLTDTVGELWNAQGVLLHSTDDISDANANFSMSTGSMSPGTYYIAVRGYDFAATGAYVLNLAFTGTFGVAPYPDTNTAAITLPVAAGAIGHSSFDIRSLGSGTLIYSIAASVPWIHLSTTSGSSIGEWDTINFSVDADELPAGVTSVGSIQITAPGATTRTVLVSAIVAAAIPALPQPQLTIAPGGTSLQVQWAGQSGRIMHLEVSDTLAPGSWVRVPDAITVGGAGANVTLPISGGITKRFYRLVLDN